MWITERMAQDCFAKFLSEDLAINDTVRWFTRNLNAQSQDLCWSVREIAITLDLAYRIVENRSHKRCLQVWYLDLQPKSAWQHAFGWDSFIHQMGVQAASTYSVICNLNKSKTTWIFLLTINPRRSAKGIGGKIYAYEIHDYIYFTSSSKTKSTYFPTQYYQVVIAKLLGIIVQSPDLPSQHIILIN